MKICRLVTPLLLLLTIAVPFAGADPIAIDVTGGSAVVSGPASSGQISITGTQGFALDATLFSEGRLDPALCSPCAPGASISTSAFWSGRDVSVRSLSLNGNPIAFHSLVDTLDLAFTGPAVLAPARVTDQVVLTRSFTFDGQFFHDPQGLAATINGFGTSTLTLERAFEGADLWSFGGIRYDFANAAAVTPEPGTLMLLGTGLIVVARGLRRRRKGQERASH